jgi:hypothetical protein
VESLLSLKDRMKEVEAGTTVTRGEGVGASSLEGPLLLVGAGGSVVMHVGLLSCFRSQDPPLLPIPLPHCVHGRGGAV